MSALTRSVDTGGPVDTDVHRRVEHVMGMPVSLAVRGRNAAAAGGDPWAAVIDELRDVDRVFSTYRDDSVISRLDRGELALDECPPEVAEVLALGRAAERQSDGAFSIELPGEDGRRRLDPSGVVKGWAVQRAARFLRAVEDIDFCLSAGGDLSATPPTRTAPPGGSASSTRTIPGRSSPWSRSDPEPWPPRVPPTGDGTSSTPAPVAPSTGSRR